MNKLVSIIFILALFSQYFQASAQITPFGLDSSNISSLSISEKRAGMSHLLLAGASSGGVFSCQPEIQSPQWISLGLENYSVSDVFVQTAGTGPLDFYLLYSSVKPMEDAGTTHLIFKKDLRINTPEWIPADSGLNGPGLATVRSLTGFHFSGQEPPEPIYCVMGGDIYKSVPFTEEPWDRIASFGGLVTLKSFSDSILWGGGTTVAFAPFLIKSTDHGKSWDTIHPEPGLVGGDNTVYDIAIDPQHPDTLYTALWSRIIKSTDGGKSWEIAGLNNTNFVFFSILVNPLDPDHLVTGGADENDRFLFFESINGGGSWLRMEPVTTQPGPVARITDMAGQIIDGEFTVYIGTLGSGIFIYKRNPSSVYSDRDRSTQKQFSLDQNYPNPFNGSTVISFRLPKNIMVELNVYDLAGRFIDQAYSGEKLAGLHSIRWEAGVLPSGVYILRLNAGQYTQSRKIILMK